MKHKKGDVKRNTASYMKYAGLSFQMGAIFLIGIFGGKKIDAFFGLEKPFITIFLLLSLFIGFMYKLFLDLNRNND